MEDNRCSVDDPTFLRMKNLRTKPLCNLCVLRVASSQVLVFVRTFPAKAPRSKEKEIASVVIFAPLRLCGKCLVGAVLLCVYVVHRTSQKRSSIKASEGEAFNGIIDLKYLALSIRASQVLGPTLTSIPALRSASKPLPLTLGFGSVVQQTTLFTLAAIKASQQGGVRLTPPRWEQGSRLT